MKHVLRRLRRSPMFTAMTLLTLAVGIGANTAVFSVVNGVLMKPLAFREPERLVALWLTAPGVNIPQLNASASVYFTYKEEGRVFQELGLWGRNSVTVTGIAEPEEAPALMVTEGTLRAVAVQPVLGRWFSAKDDAPGSPETILLSYGYWQQRFGGDNGILGRKIVVDTRPREIIGVMPRSFHFMNLKPSLILPYQLNRSDAFVGGFNFQALARLKPGVTIAQANADIARMLPMLPAKFRLAPGMNPKMLEEARFAPDVRPLVADVIGDAGKLLWVLMGTVGIVLFIACANVANLLLVRADGRRRELAIRAALGAGWLRIARELLMESVALGITGGLLGLGLAYVALRALVAAAPIGLPRLEEIGIDTPVILFALGVSVMAGLFFGLIPVFKYVGPQLVASIHEGGRTIGVGRERHRARSVLVVVQVALALVLLVSSGLMIRTFAALKQVQPGFQRPEEILTLRISIPRGQVQEPERVARMQHDIADRIAAVAGIASVGISNGIAMDGSRSFDPIYVEGRTYAESQIPPMRRYKWIGPGYFQTMGNPLMAGRDLTWTDIFDQRPVVVISENFAREYWGSAAGAVGKRVRENNRGVWREIIGVAGNERDHGVDQKAPSIVYWPVLTKDQWNPGVQVRRGVAYAIRSKRTGTADFLKDVQQAIWSVNPNLPLAEVRTVQELYERSMGRTSFALVVLAIAAGMALLLGIVGIYGVISYSVSQRTREIGIRMALGARQSEVSRLFLRHGLVLAAIGMGCGLAAAVGLMRWMSGLLFEVKPVDPLTYVAVSAVLLVAALAASYLPARRATGIEPVEALRAE